MTKTTSVVRGTLWAEHQGWRRGAKPGHLPSAHHLVKGVWGTTMNRIARKIKLNMLIPVLGGC